MPSNHLDDIVILNLVMNLRLMNLPRLVVGIVLGIVAYLLAEFMGLPHAINIITGLLVFVIFFFYPVG